MHTCVWSGAPTHRYLVLSTFMKNYRYFQISAKPMCTLALASVMMFKVNRRTNLIALITTSIARGASQKLISLRTRMLAHAKLRHVTEKGLRIIEELSSTKPFNLERTFSTHRSHLKEWIYLRYWHCTRLRLRSTDWRLRRPLHRRI